MSQCEDSTNYTELSFTRPNLFFYLSMVNYAKLVALPALNAQWWYGADFREWKKRRHYPPRLIIILGTNQLAFLGHIGEMSFFLSDHKTVYVSISPLICDIISGIFLEVSFLFSPNERTHKAISDLSQKAASSIEFLWQECFECC